ncbi:MAG TPA: hypothetical protein VLT59_13685 [Steroidobacteraceae bacterium]|nr:hypothetical protein [Steroidobacteraceae bacterium]
MRDATEWVEARYRIRREHAVRSLRTVSGSAAQDPAIDPTRVWPVPALNAPLARTTLTRRHTFARRLIGLLRDLWSERDAGADGQAPEPAETRPTGTPHSPLATAACATCRGRCCQYGGDHAFIDLDVLRQQRRADPRVTARELLDRYLSRLPATGIEGSCLYHSATGCNLPRALRSSICEQYLCGDVRRLLNEADPALSQPIWLMAINDGDQAPSRTRRIDAAAIAQQR